MKRKPYLGGKRRPTCHQCGRFNNTRHVFCRRCRESFNVKQNAEYWVRRAAGECVDCGRTSSKAHCDACRAQRRKRPSRDGNSPRVKAQRRRWRLNAKRRAQEAGRP